MLVEAVWVQQKSQQKKAMARRLYDIMEIAEQCLQLRTQSDNGSASFHYRTQKQPERVLIEDMCFVSINAINGFIQFWGADLCN